MLERIGALASLRKLDLQQSRLTRLPDSIGDLRCLEHLNLAASGLEALPDSFTRLTQLRFLDITVAPDVIDIGDRLGGLENLEHLALYADVLRSLRGSLTGLRKLHTLKVYSRGRDEGDVELLAFAKDLPALKTLGVPYGIRERVERALPGVAVT